MEDLGDFVGEVFVYKQLALVGEAVESEIGDGEEGLLVLDVFWGFGA